MNDHYKQRSYFSSFLKKGLAVLVVLLWVPLALNAQNYCQPQPGAVGANAATEPISLVRFGSGPDAINNASSSEVSASIPKYEDFSNISMNVAKGSTYTLMVKGNTDGNSTNYITIYIDWNQNGVFSNSLSENEKYQYTTALINSTGQDDKSVVLDIVIPQEALLGQARMRIVKNYQSPSPNPCASAFTFGQAEDYTLNVTEATAATDLTVTTQNNVPAAITTTGGTLQLAAAVIPANANQAVTWSITQGSAFATVSANGLVTAIANGTVTITAISVSDSSVSGSIQITISNQTTSAVCTFIPVALTGFNADVIAEGSGSDANNKATQPIDGANGYYAQDFVPASPHSSGASATAYGAGLANNGTINSTAVSGLIFQMADYTGNNALVLRNSLTNNGTLSFTQPKKAQKIYVAWVSAEGTNNVDVTVNFADGTTQVFTAQQAPDWWSDAVPSSTIKAAGPLGRVSVITSAAWAPVNSFSGLTQTYLFQKELELSSSNHNKLITSVGFTKATSANAATTTAVLGISICETPAEPVIYGPVTITGGFNHDIIANGIGDASASSTIGFDETNSRALVSLDFKATASASVPAYGLPVSGIINSVQTNGVTFRLADYTGNNALFLTPAHVGNGAPNSGTLSFNAQNAGTLYLLAGAAGGGRQVLAFTATVNFSDNTTQTTTLSVNDWYNGSDYAIQAVGRINRTNNNLEGDSSNPRLYEIALPIEAVNQSKAITGITFAFNGDQTAEWASQIRMSVLAVTTAPVVEAPADTFAVVTSNNVPAVITQPGGVIQIHGVYNGTPLYSGVTYSVTGGTGRANVDQYGQVTAVANGTVIIRGVLGSDPSLFAEIEIVISGQQQGYCEAYFINGCNEYVNISGFSTTGADVNINNLSSGCSNDHGLSGYADFTAQSVTAAQGAELTFTLNFNTPGLGTAYLSAWVDWNQDFVFSDDEQIYASQDSDAGAEPDVLSFTVNVPQNASLGATRIRLKAVNGWIGSGACGYNSYGEVEDYTFNVTAPATIQSVSVATLNNADAVITTVNGTLQLLATVNPSAADQNVTWSIAAGNAFASVDENGLVIAIANGTITVRATSEADATKYGELTVVIAMPTNNCPSLTELYENFDNYSCCEMGVVPTCWNSIRLGNASQIISSTNPASGTSQIYQFGYGNGVVSIVALPHFSNVNAGTHQFRFKVKANSQGALDFGYITDINDASTFVIIESLTINNTSYNSSDAERTLSVPTTVPAGARLAVRNPGTTFAGMYWDDVYWEPIPVVPVTAVTVTVANNAAPVITTNEGTLQLAAEVTPVNATNTDVVWTITAGSEYASVDENGVVTAIANGVVTVRATAEDGTIYGEIEITIDIILGLDDVTKLNYSIYPNPTKSVVTISATNALKDIVVHNMVGQEIYRGNQNQVDLQNVEQGVYIFTVRFKTGATIVQKVIKN